ncbi:lysoplasmalogenase [Edwardsiella tarda]|uniref:YhhN-like protein n=1 Tax=Edwardsiella tarda ATCC 23685 TaxID=500638 RepID=D4FAF0_EDWTA|nr:lysoplasmalogenase [Edwardsiella tarda]AKH87763.1 lysoplasmalogenase [Edwardsiella tarda]ATI64370.1 lysoplasmalogenase [Edwardsiella tarda]EFE21292.1 YhhN-like protein [Edwardsiella tarda ATCC 23685]UCQ11510.1 lysoplasmalogenase [Edwardsiella tarda]UCQ18018.1 lysoplasmalogenase [Edwardsiella tarda]
MSWAFLAVLFSGWLYVDASYRGPSWQRWLFKPLTLLLLLLLGWNAPQLGPSGYFILCGLLATLIADALLLLPRERMLYAIGALFLSQLLYTIGFASGMTMALYWPPLLILLAIGVVLLAIIWGRLDTLRWPVVTYVAMMLVMVWVAGAQYFARGDDQGFSLLLGAWLLLLANSIWLIDRFRVQFRAAGAIIAFGYFVGLFLIVRSLYL